MSDKKAGKKQAKRTFEYTPLPSKKRDDDPSKEKVRRSIDRSGHDIPDIIDDRETSEEPQL